MPVSRRRFLALTALGLPASYLLSSCGGPSAGSSAAAGSAGAANSATIALPGVMVESMNPYAHSTTQIYPTWRQIIEPLVEWDWTTKKVVPALAESWTNPDPNTWLFKLRQGVKFSDGTEFISADVVHSITRIVKDPDSKQGSNLTEIDSMETPDATTVKMHTKIPDAALPLRLAQRFMTSKAAYDKLGAAAADKLALGTGPYKFKEWVPAQRFVVEKNAAYRPGPRQPTIDTAIFRNIPESEAAITALLNNEVDQISNVQPESAARLTGNAHKVTVRTVNIMFLGMHASVPQFKNKLVRQAVNYAIDRQAIVQDLLKGAAYPLDAPIGPDQYGYSADIAPKYTFDLQKAKQLLSQAGYPAGFDVDFVVPLGQYQKIKEIGEAIAAMLAKAGINTKLQTPDQNTGFGAIQEGKAPMYVFGRGDVIDPSEYLEQYFMTGVTKRLGYSNPEMDKALQAQQGAFDPTERLKLLQQAMSLLMEEAPVAWLFQYQGIEGVSNRFDYTPNPGESVYAWDFQAKAK